MIKQAPALNVPLFCQREDHHQLVILQETDLIQTSLLDVQGHESCMALLHQGGCWTGRRPTDRCCPSSCLHVWQIPSAATPARPPTSATIACIQAANRSLDPAPTVGSTMVWASSFTQEALSRSRRWRSGSPAKRVATMACVQAKGRQGGGRGEAVEE